MDRTVLYREIVRIAGESHDSPPAVVNEPVPDQVTQEVNSIANQLARLIASLRLLRPRYLALRGPQQMSEAERDEFDYSMRQLVQREQRRVRALEDREQQRVQELAAKQSSFAARWLSDPETEGIEQTLAEHRRGMFFYLNMQLQNVSQSLGDLQSVRLARGHGQTKKKEDALAIPDLPSIPHTPSEKPSVNESEPHMLLVQEEHNTLLEDLNATLAKAQSAEQSMREIGELQSELNQHLATQTSQLNSLTSDAFRTTSHVSSANTQLERSKKKSKQASRVIIMSSLATGIFLLLLNGR